MPSEDDYWQPNISSGDYPWYRSMTPPASSSRPPSRTKTNPDEHDLTESVNATFEKSDSAYKPHHYFDYIAGTSTGGLSAIMLGRMQMNIDAALSQYDTVGNDVFGKPRPLHVQLKFADLLAPKYGPKQMERAIQKVINVGLAEEMGQHNNEEPYTKEKIPFLSNPKKCRTIIIAHGPGTNKAYESSYLFRTYDHPHPSPLSERDDIRGHKNPGPAHTHEIWRIARATAAAPKYFSNIEIGDRTFRDGGMGANNPSSLALKEVRQMHAQNPRLLLSVGTGRPSDKGKVPRNQGYIRDWGNLVGLLSKLATQSESTHQDVRDDCKALGITYFRQNVGSALKDMKLDEWKPSTSGARTKERILSLTKKHLQHRNAHEDLLRCAEELVQVRRERARGDRWEAFAHDYVYVCQEQTCKGPNSHSFFGRDDLRRHAIEEHEFVPLVPIKNPPRRYQYACVYDTCSHYGIHVFRDEDALRSHLCATHKFEQPRLKSPEDVEWWLDQSRMTQTEALRRSNTDSTTSDSTDSPQKEPALVRDSLHDIRAFTSRKTANLKRPP
ncbi:FabD/lysophospholipase-like protein [Viridothelium virens]|uniref:FabD/lysophospholipase-like protein n=1 Tax=Viridothelium virens TaxID=1048519 RepID=A0A6A6GWX0_VIRVR|nr:FabD/lysophospholipase-like protein [Viridothelium virens]